MYIHQHASVNINSQIVPVGPGDMPDIGDYQFYLVQQGTVTISYPDSDKRYVLQPNDMIALDPVTPFQCSSMSKGILACVRIDPLFIESLIPQGYSLRCNSVRYTSVSYQQLSNILYRICSNFFSSADTYKVLSLIYEFADELKRNFIVPDSLHISDHERHIRERKEQIISVLRTRYTQSLTLGQLAEDLFLTPQYLSRFIKKHFHTSFTSLLTQIRLEHAYNELMHSDDSITNIALNNGFPNIASFHKVFRGKYGTSPSSYRQQNKQEIDESMPFYPLSPATIPERQSDSTTFDISIDSLSAASYKMPWKDTINIGMLSSAMKNSFHENFLEYRQYIPVKYIRFCGLFSDEILPYNSETKEYNFSNLDVIFNFFYRNDVIPFIEIRSEVPVGHMAAPSAGSLEPFSEMTNSDAARLLTKILLHYLRIYGLAYLSQWRYEVWWKVDSILCAMETPQEYAIRYLEFEKAVRKVIPNSAIGGPCFNMCGNFRDFTDFMDQMASENISFDFISVAAFSYEVQSQYKNEELPTIGILSPDADHIERTFAMYHHFIRNSHYATSPVFITEFGSTLSLQNHICESVYQAAFLCKNMLSLNQHCSCIAYNYFADTYTPASSANTQGIPAFLGLLSERGVPRPAFHAYHFLSMLGKNLIAQGNNYIVTSSSKTRYQLLCFHYTHFDANFCFHSWDKVNLENTYDVFPEDASQQIHFRCNALPPGRYKVTQLSLNRGYGSALDKYLRILKQGNTTSAELLSTILTLREDELNYYKKTSIPRQEIFYFKNDGTVDLECTLDSHEMVFYEMQKVL